MRKRVLLFLLPFPVFSQISGVVQNAQNETLPFVNVVLYQVSDTSIVSGTSSDEHGEFSLVWEQPGNYFLTLSSIGLQTFYTSPFSLNQISGSLNLGLITLKENANELNEVVVSAKKELIQNTPYGQIVNVQSSLMTQGSNALQVLERLPGILIDKRHNQFSLNGQSGVTILFNGRKIPMSMADLTALLENTLADNIANIELITSPSAKYDSDGGAGIINFVFKKNENEGSQLSINASLGYGFKEKASTALTYSIGKNKLTLNASYSFNHNKSKNGFEGFGTSNMPVLGAPSSGVFSTYYNNNFNTNNLNLGLDYKLTTKTTLGAELNYSHAQAQNLTNIRNTREILNKQYIESKLLSEGAGIKQNLISSLYLTAKPTEKSSFNIDLNYLGYTNNSPNQITSTYLDKNGETLIPYNEIFTAGNNSQNSSSIYLGVMKLDYSQKINPKLETEFGLKASYSENKNNSKIETNVDGTWQTDPRSQNLIASDEKLWAVYSQVKILPNPKSTIDLGLRYEYWNRTITTNGEPFTISQFFPSFLYHYTVSETSFLSFGANRRISRPAYEDLVSGLFYNDPTAFFTGNPLLKPSIINTIKVEYSKNGFSLGISALRELNPIIRYQLTANSTNDVLLISPQNAEYQNSLNLFVNIPIQWAEWAKLSLSSTTSFRKYKIAYSLSPAIKSFVFQNINFIQTFKLPFQMETEISGWRNFANFNGTNKNEGFGIVNVGLAKKLKDNKGTFQFTVSDVFQTFNIKNYNGAVTPLVFEIETESRYRDESGFARIFRLSYSRNFGTISQSKTRKSGAEEERQRVN